MVGGRVHPTLAVNEYMAVHRCTALNVVLIEGKLEISHNIGPNSYMKLDYITK